MDLDKPISIRYRSQELEELETLSTSCECVSNRSGRINAAANLLEASVAERTGN